MRWLREHLLAVLAAVLVVAGLGLMIASLRIESSTTTAAAAAASSVVVPASASVGLVAATPSRSDSAATRLLTRAQTASRSLAYGGVKLVRRYDAGATGSVLVTVDHVPGQGTRVAPGDTDLATAPASAVTIQSGPYDEAAALDVLVRHYRLVSDGTATVANRPAHVVVAERADGTAAARFAVDDATGLVLRRELLGPDGRTLESSGFVRVGFADPSASASAEAPAPGATAFAWSPVAEDGILALRTAGWPVLDTLGGRFELYGVREQKGAQGPVVQLAYTDGLAAMSVFLQQGNLDSAALDGFVAETVDGGQVWVRTAGAPFAVWQTRVVGEVNAGGPPATARDIVVSATTDSPLPAIGTVVAALPADPAASVGVGDRVSRGLDRFSSWLDPAH